MIWKRLRSQTVLAQVIWATLSVAFVAALIEGRWSLAFIAVVTFALSLLPVLFVHRFGIALPIRFTGAIVAFIFATIFLGEAFDFYNRYWWWDIALHGGSAVGFGLMGFLFVFMLFEGDRYAAPAWALALIALSFGVMIGVIWEIFEFAMDQLFGLNMQKSGLVDTMWDLIVDVAGAGLGAMAGFLYLKGRSLGGLGRFISEFVATNRRFFRRNRRD